MGNSGDSDTRMNLQVTGNKFQLGGRDLNGASALAFTGGIPYKAGGKYSFKMMLDNGNMTVSIAEITDGVIGDYTASATFKWVGDVNQVDIGAGFNDGDFKGHMTTDDLYVNQAVPEPTALALLLMGVAAIGLRRKARAA